MSRPALRAAERPLKVLIVGDSESEQGNLRRVLSADGMKTFELPSAIGATREALAHAVDAAVIELGTSEQAGERLVNLLRANRRLAHLLIVVICEQSSEDIPSLRKTADAIISKQRTQAELASTLRHLHTRALAARPFERGPDA